MWSMREAYEKLWELYEDNVVNTEIKPHYIPAIANNYDLVISTIPANMICLKPEEHEFNSAKIKIARMEHEVPPISGTHIVIYNGQLGRPWYRYSKIDKVESWEYGAEEFQAGPLWCPREDVEWVEGFKPLNNTCDCHPELHRAGRFGQWEKGVLTHHAFEYAVGVFSGGGVGHAVQQL